MRVAVNLSARQFHHHDIVRSVRGALEEADLDPVCLELALTESVLMRHTDGAISALRALREMGVHLAIDDFGTGYSSLCYLKYFPVSRLKIVAPFVSPKAAYSNDEAIAKAIVAMAHSLDIRVIAEGVERAEDLAFVHSLQCDEVQGNIFCSAIPAEEGSRLLSEENRFAPSPQWQ